MKRKAHELQEEANEARGSGRLVDAGNLYTVAAYEYAGVVTEHIFPEPDQTRGAVSMLRYAGMCYRLVGDDFRTENRCDMGILLAEDYLEFIERQEFEVPSFAAARRGAWPEFIGDLHHIAGRDEAANAAYDRAHEIYLKGGNYEISTGEQEHTRLTAFLRSIRHGLGHELDEQSDLELQPLGPSMTDWLEYKRELLPGYLDDLEEQGSWPVE